MRFLSVLLLLSSLLFSVSTTMSMQELNKLTASDGASDDNFGISVAISGDTAIVGAYHDSNESGAKIGSAYIFERDSDTGLFHQTAKLTASDGADGDQFGKSVAISGDSVVVGANLDDATDAKTGSVYIYEKPGTGWEDSNQESAKLTASDGTYNDQFGFSVAMSGDSVVVGVPGYDEVFGADLGSAYIYEKPDSGWEDSNQESTKLTASDGDEADFFGHSVAISGDSIVVGAYGDDDIGSQAGCAYLYENPGTGWADATQSAILKASDRAISDRFGWSVAISGDTVVVGADGDDDLGDSSGSAYIYEKPDSGWEDTNQESAKLTASDGVAYDRFGISVAMSGDSVLVGAYVDDDLGDSSGSAYIYERDTATDLFHQTTKLTASDGADYDVFGISVAMSGDSVLVGAYADDDSGDNSGSAYVFKAKPSGINPAIIMYLLN